jgi:hypothetical protein
VVRLQLTVSLSTQSASCSDLSASSRMWLLAPRSTMVHASPSATPAHNIQALMQAKLFRGG